MTNPIKHVRETGEFVQISPVDYVRKPKPAVMGYRADDPIPSDNETLIYWKKAFEDKVRENARLEDRIKVLRMELDVTKSMVDQAIKYKRGL